MPILTARVNELQKIIDLLWFFLLEMDLASLSFLPIARESLLKPDTSTSQNNLVYLPHSSTASDFRIREIARL
jgi:hypothetical protein